MAPKRIYQLHYSRGKDVLRDVPGRFQKFKKMLGVIKDFYPDTKSLNCLDIGCSNGIITSFLRDHFSRVIGIDIDEEAIRYARAHHSSSQVQFLVGDSMVLPFPNSTIDVVICNHIYEHVPDARMMIEEIYRVLKENGFCYLAAANKYMIIEGHYHLPFLSWLPKFLAHLYLRVSRKGNVYYEKHLSLRGLRKMVWKFAIRDYTLSIIHDPEKFSATDLFNPSTISYRLIRWLAPYLYPLIPTYIWILTKK